MTALAATETIRVLLVEDDEDDYVLTRDLLADTQGISFELDWVSDGRLALEQICEGGHDVCLLDYRLGAQTGIDVLREAISQGCGMPVILLTGQGDKETDLEAMRAGAHDYLVKGQINSALLDRAIRYAIQKQRTQDERLRRAREEAARAEAEAANRAKDDFIAMVSHELRNPLGAILNSVRILRGGTLQGEHVTRALDVIDRNTRRQVQLVDDLLDVARIVNGTLRITHATVDLREAIDAAIEVVQFAVDEKKIRLVTDLDVNPIRVSGDADRLQQVVWNLLTNAVKFSLPGGLVSVRLGRDGEHAVLVVADTGKGIAPELLPYIFDRFRQAEGAVATRTGGLGLGLAIVRHLVEAHGGTVHAESEGDARGATFTVRLPLGGME